MAIKLQLRSKIFGIYKSESDCARQMGWNKQRLNKIVNGIKEPTVKELQELATAFNCSVSEVADIFLAEKSPIE